MFDLEAYSKKVHATTSVEQLLDLFVLSMMHVGWKVLSFQQLTGGGANCDPNKNSSQRPEYLFSTGESLLSDEALRAAIVSHGVGRGGAFLFNMAQNSVLCRQNNNASPTDLCVSLHGDDGTQAIVVAKLDPPLPSVTESMLNMAQAMVAVCYEKYQAINLAVPEPVHLTSREAQILRLASIGETKRSIADDLGVTNHAVDFHYRNIMKKYKTKKIVVAVAQAIRTGVI